MKKIEWINHLMYSFYSHNSGKGAHMSNFFPSKFIFEIDELQEVVELPQHILNELKQQYGQITCSWSEQGFMLAKCVVFMEKFPRDNMKIFKKLVNAKGPAECKSLGREVRGFKENVWKKYRCKAMYFSVLRKYKQNPHLAEKLLATESLTLVEASPTDLVWGVGLRSTDPRIVDPGQWKGLNLLGDCLMTVREQLH